MVLPEILAIGAAICFAASSIFIKKGLEHSDTNTGVFVSLSVNVIVLWIILLLTTPLSLLMNSAIFIFVAAGFLAPGIARILRFESFDRLGVAKTAPISATTPLYATALAVIFLGEKLTFAIGAGIFLIVLGTIVISRFGKLTKEDIIFAVGASLLAGISTPIRKYGLTQLNYPLIVSAVTALTAFTVVIAFIVIKGSVKKIRHIDLKNEGVKLFAVSGLLTSIAFILNFTALSKGSVVTVAPLLQTMPLFSLLFTHMYLKHLEEIHANVWVGTFIILAGVLVLTIFGGVSAGLGG